MNDTPIQLRNPDVADALKEPNESTGYAVLDAYGGLVKATIPERLKVGPETFAKRLAVMDEISRLARELRVTGDTLTIDDLYDEDGLPK